MIHIDEKLTAKDLLKPIGKLWDASAAKTVFSDVSAEHLRAVRELCAKLFEQPHRIEQSLMHEISSRFTIPLHEHRGVLQFDLIEGCRGHAWSQGKRHAIHGMTLMVSYPKQPHGYELMPGPSPSRVYNLKLAAPASWRFCRQAVCPTLVTGLSPSATLIELMRQVVRLGTVQSSASLLMVTRLCELIVLWPQVQMGRLLHDVADMDPRLQRALDAIEHRLGASPTVNELARLAHLSPRHLARQFRTTLGCTVHDYINARKLSHAQQRLLGEQHTVARVAEELGFSSCATFSRWFKQAAGVSPTEYRKSPHTL